MAEVVASATQPALGAIKLAWWRESLEKLDDGPAPAEPRLQAAATELLTRGITGGELARLEEGWAALLETEQERPAFIVAAEKRGPLLFELGARLLGSPPSEDLREGGRQFAAADLARRGVYDLVPLKLGRPPRSPGQLRPLTMLKALAWRDMQRGGPPFEPEATPGRAWTLLRHRITGR